MPEAVDGTNSVAYREDVTEPGDLGFLGEHRLHAAAEFSSVFAARRVLRGECFVLHYQEAGSGSQAPSVSAHGARLGLVVAKKLARRAVQRNLLKRLAREAFRHAHRNLPPCDVILRLSKSPGKSMDTEARRVLRADVDRLLTRLACLPLSSLPR